MQHKHHPSPDAWSRHHLRFAISIFRYRSQWTCSGVGILCLILILSFLPQKMKLSLMLNQTPTHIHTLTSFTNILIQQNRRECVPCRCDLSRGNISSPFWRDNLNEYSNHTASHEDSKKRGERSNYPHPPTSANNVMWRERHRTYYNRREYPRLCVGAPVSMIQWKTHSLVDGAKASQEGKCDRCNFEI